ncbi:MAG TPA: hypothetical protein VJ650_09300 [Gemmatimonadaceae bacterium]|nr:hypothetical protein [Gemmatimonadaceae bacterium]
MRRPAYAALVLGLAAVIHIDWHLARPVHHRLSLGWTDHWIFAVAAFAIVGCLIARGWPDAPARAAAGIVGLAVLLAQGVEPVLEVAFYDHQLGYPDDPGRWGAFALCLAAGLPALVATLVVCRPRARSGGAVTPAN